MTRIPLETSAVWQLIEVWPHRACVISLIEEMTSEGYAAKTIRSTVRIISSFLRWNIDRPDGVAQPIGYGDIDHFIADRGAAAALRYGERCALQRLRAKLLDVGIVEQPRPDDDPLREAVANYAADLRRRGYAEQSIRSHLWFVKQFLDVISDNDAGVSRLTHDDVRNYLSGRLAKLSAASGKAMCSRLRGFLRFLHSSGMTTEDLALAVPSVRNLRQASLPTFMTPTQLEHVLQACDRSTIAGRRDFAVLLLLARLGLRACEAASLTLDDIDWRAGLVRVKGKGGRIATMPLPQDVGAAIAEYILQGRPRSGSRVIFHRVETPCTPFRTSTPVILIARRALKRAGISGLRSHHAHVFRHSLATTAIRSGATLAEIGQLLRHREPDTTRIYAKLDVDALRSLSRPWGGAAQ